jgi:hypothetical protein
VYARGQWGLVKVDVANTSDGEAVLPAQVFVGDNSSLRFGRDIWVPPHGRRTTWLPIHLAPQSEVAASQATFEGRSGGKEFSNQARLVQERFPMAVLLNRIGHPYRSEQDEEAEDDAYELILALRSSLDLSRQVAIIEDRLLPPTVEGWDAVGHAVLAGDRLDDDAAGQAALRQWVAAGGKLWIQLDKTPLETVQNLLGDACHLQIVDQVSLTSLPNDFSTTKPIIGEPLLEERELDGQVELVRVLVSDAEVLSQVHGWPTSFAVVFGRGEVLVTTLGPHGWMRMRTAAESAVEGSKWTKYVATDPLRDFQYRFLHGTVSDTPSDEVQRDYLVQRIGYQVPSRMVVLSLLFGFCGLIGIGGALLARAHRLEHLSWLTVASALTVATVVATFGSTSKQAVPPTAAQVQFVEVVPQADTAAGSGSLAIFQPDLNTVELTSTASLRLNPQMPDLAGRVRQINWTDLNRWHFEDMELPPGVRIFDAQMSIAGDDVVPRAVGRFGPRGLEGELTVGTFGSAEDALVAPAFATPLGANLASDGGFHAGPADLLASGQYTADQLLSEEQLRRQKLMESWFGTRLPDSPVHLVAWSEPLTDVLQWSAGTRQVGASLISVPVTIERTAPSTPVAIPDALMGVQTISGSSGQSTYFDNRTRQWQYPQTSATITRLRWQLPAATLPMVVSQAKLSLDGNVPSRQLDIYLLHDDDQIPVLQRSNHSGRIQIDLSNSDQLSLDDQGGLTLEIAVSELTAQPIGQAMGSNATWSIRSTTLDVWGKTLPEGTEKTP